MRRWAAFGVLALSILVSALDNTILNIALPTLQRELGARGAELQWMVDAYVLAYAGLLLVMGSVADRWGRRRVLQTGLVLFGAASVLAAFAQSGGQLVVLRALMGMGAAMMTPASLAIVTDVFPPEERSTPISLWSAVAGVGVALGPLVGGALLEAFWWGSVFLVNAPIVAVALVAGRWLLPESRGARPAPLDLPGTVLSALAVAAFVFAIIEGPERGWGDGLVLAMLAAAVFLGAFFARWELGNPEPMLQFGRFRDPRFSLGALAITLAFFGLFAITFGGTQYLQFVKGATPLEAGCVIFPAGFGVMAGAVLSPRLVRRVGVAAAIVAGMGLQALTLVAVLLFEPGTPLAFFALNGLVLGLAIGSIMAPSTSAIVGAVPDEEAGVASAVNSMTRQLGGAAGVAVVGSIFATLYRGRVGDGLAGLAPETADAAGVSLGGAVAVAGTLPGEVAARVLETSGHAFTDAFGLGSAMAGGLLLAGAVIVLRFMPRRN